MFLKPFEERGSGEGSDLGLKLAEGAGELRESAEGAGERSNILAQASESTGNPSAR